MADQPTPSPRQAISDIVRSRWVSFLTLGLLLLLGGILAIALPVVSTLAVSLTVGILLAACGLIQVVQSFQARGWSGFLWHLGIGVVQVTIVLALGDVLFDVPLRGSLLELYVAALVFIVASLSLGVFLSTLANSQFQAMQMAFFTFLPQILLSGFMFPYAGMPVAAQYVAEILPLTHFLRLIRGIMLRGATLGELWPSLAALGVFIVIVLGLAVSRVRKRLD